MIAAGRVPSIRRSPQGSAGGAAAALAAVAAVVFAAASAAEVCGPVFGSRVVSVEGERLAALRRTPLDRLRVWTFVAGRREAIPFQVDQCGDDGRVVLDPAAAIAAFPGPRSVLLFAVRDARERAPTPPSDAVEIEVGDRIGGPRRWAYVGSAPELASSARDYVDYEAGRETVHGERYTLGFHGSFADYFAVAQGKGADGPNLLDRLKARVDARFLWGLISFRRNEEEVTSEVVGSKDGPIRVIVRRRLKIRIGWGVPSPEIVSDEYFYADDAQGPVTVSLPFPIGYVFGDLDVRIYLDFRSLDGFEVLANGIASGTMIVGEPPPPLAEPPPTSWFALVGPSAVLVHRLRFEQDLAKLDVRLLYVDDPLRRDPPEGVRGLRPGVGYDIRGWESVGGGRHEIWLDTFVLDRAAFDRTPGMIEALALSPEVVVHPPR